MVTSVAAGRPLRLALYPLCTAKWRSRTPLTCLWPFFRHRNFHLADAFTLMNGFCGAQSLFASGRYLITSDPSHAWAALWFPFFGAIFDLLDGKVARWRNSSSMLGQELDSLADSVSCAIGRACMLE